MDIANSSLRSLFQLLERIIDVVPNEKARDLLSETGLEIQNTEAKFFIPGRDHEKL